MRSGRNGPFVAMFGRRCRRVSSTLPFCASIQPIRQPQQQQQMLYYSSLSSSSLFQIHPMVQEALRNRRPVVALESTIVAHGMPFPQNLLLSQRVAQILRQKGVEPATIAIKDGICRVGLTVDELEDLARSGQDGRAEKCSTRELSWILSRHRHARTTATTKKKGQFENVTTSSSSLPPQWGATTVASTMKLAHMAGIATFVTGGIGGVHRHHGEQHTMDISADLTELSRTPVVVVSAGIKSILDIPKTLQVLETYGVPTIAYQTDEFPAFFSPHSGVMSPMRMDSCEEIAAAYWIGRQTLGLSHGMLVAVPNADPAGANVENAIHSALRQAESQGIVGRSVTPFVLKRVAEETSGDSLRSNMALVERNAEIGAEIAIAIANQGGPGLAMLSAPARNVPGTPPYASVIVMGGSVLDIIARPAPGQQLVLGTSNPRSCLESDGGVGRNIAEVLGRLGSHPLLYSSVGNDSRGLAMIDRLSKECGVVSPSTTISVLDGAHTATYVAVLDESGDLHTACADMTVLDQIPSPPLEVLEQAQILVIDANPSIETLRETAIQATQCGVKVFLEPTSEAKARKVASDDALMACLSYASPNLDEFIAMSGGSCRDDLHVVEEGEDAAWRQLAHSLLQRMNPNGAHLLITCGSKGVLLASKETTATNEFTFQQFRAPEGAEVLNATGAGDTLTGAFIHGLLQGESVEDAILLGMKAATISLQCSEKAISPELSQLAFLHR